MEKEIWKYKLKHEERQNIIMPRNSQILSVQAQDDQPCLWVLVSPNQVDTECRNIEIYRTGQTILYSDEGVKREFLGTFQLYDGSLVFHVFEYTGI